MKKRLLIFTLIAPLVSAGAIKEQLHSVAEQQVEWKNHGLKNPFTDAELRLHITAPDGRAGGSRFDFFGFYDGDGKGGQTGDIWKFRILLDAPGPWTVQPVFVDPESGAALPDAPALKPFHYTVGFPAAHHGRISVDSEGGLRYVYADGTPFFPFAFHASSMLDNVPEESREYIDEHLKLGIDNLTVRFHSDSRRPGLRRRYQWLLSDGTSGAKWPGDADAFDYSRFDLSTWHYNEQFIDYALARGMHLSIWFGISGINRQYESYGPLDSRGSDLGPRQVQFIKYLLARWGAYPHWWHWTINSEWEESKQRELNIAYALKIRELMPWPLLITNHSLRDWTLGGAEEGWDLAQLQRRVIDTDEGATDCRKFVTVNDRFGLPVFNIEGVWGLRSATRSRIATLAHLMEGGTSHVAFEGKGTSSSWACCWPDLKQGHKEAAESIGAIARWLQGAEWNRRFNSALPAHDLVSLEDGHLAMCNARPGDAYFVWCDEGGTPTLDLTAETGSFTVLQYDLNRPAQPPARSAVSGGGRAVLPAGKTTGFGNDWFYAVLSDTPDNRPRIVTRTLKPAYIGRPYVAPLRLRNAPGAVEWSVDKGTLPKGLRLENGRICGTPETAGSAEISIRAETGAAAFDRTYRLEVLEADDRPPAVSEITGTGFSAKGFTLIWKTNEPATSRVQWGDNPGRYQGESGEDPELVIDHAVFLPGAFRSGETVHVMIVTTDAANNTRWQKQTVAVP